MPRSSPQLPDLPRPGAISPTAVTQCEDGSKTRQLPLSRLRTYRPIVHDPITDIAGSISANPAEWTVYATLLLFVVTASLAWSTRTTAQAALAQVRIAFPQLMITANIVATGTAEATGKVTYLTGNLPARDIVVWVLGPPEVYYRASRAQLLPGEEFAFTGVPCEKDDTAFSGFTTPVLENSSFLVFPWINPDDNRIWLGFEMQDGKPKPDRAIRR